MYHTRKRPLGRPKRVLEDNIKLDLREIEYKSAEWINLAQDMDQRRVLASMVKNFGFHKMRVVS